MSVDLLKQISSMPLPNVFNNAKEVEAVRSLRQSGLVLAVIDEPPVSAARVLAITEEGRSELLRFSYPQRSM